MPHFLNSNYQVKGSTTRPTPMQEQIICEADATDEDDDAVKSVSTAFHLAARHLATPLQAT